MTNKQNASDQRRAFMQSDPPSGANRFAAARSTLERLPSGTAARAETELPAAAPPASSAGMITAPIEQVVENPLNARHSYNEARINELATSMALLGQLAPALACEMSDVRAMLDISGAGEGVNLLNIHLPALRAAVDSGKPYLLIGGHYRRAALQRIARPIDLKIVKVASLLDLYTLSYAENDERAETTPLDDALSWKKLLDSGVASGHEDIARATKKDRAVIVKTLSVLKLSDDVLEVLRQAKQPFSYIGAYELSRMSGAGVATDRLLQLAQMLVDGEVTTRELERLAKAAVAGAPEPRTKEHSRQHKLLSGGRQLGLVKEWDHGRVLLDIRIEDQAAREQLVQEFRRRWGGES